MYRNDDHSAPRFSRNRFTETINARPVNHARPQRSAASRGDGLGQILHFGGMIADTRRNEGIRDIKGQVEAQLPYGRNYTLILGEQAYLKSGGDFPIVMLSGDGKHYAKEGQLVLPITGQAHGPDAKTRTHVSVQQVGGTVHALPVPQPRWGRSSVDSRPFDGTLFREGSTVPSSIRFDNVSPDIRDQIGVIDPATVA